MAETSEYCDKCHAKGHTYRVVVFNSAGGEDDEARLCKLCIAPPKYNNHQGELKHVDN